MNPAVTFCHTLWTGLRSESALNLPLRCTMCYFSSFLCCFTFRSGLAGREASPRRDADTPNYRVVVVWGGSVDVLCLTFGTIAGKLNVSLIRP